MLDAKGNCRDFVVVDGDRCHSKVFFVQKFVHGGLGLRGQIRHDETKVVSELRQIREGALWAEKAMDEYRGARIVTAAGWTEDSERQRLVEREISRLHEAGEISGVVDVKVGQEHGVERLQVDPHFAESDECSRANVDENARGAVDEDHVAR